MNIPQEAVEALARWECTQDGEDFNDPDTRGRHVFHARRRLKVAAPHITAQAWEQGAKAKADAYGMDVDAGRNPYTGTP